MKKIKKKIVKKKITGIPTLGLLLNVELRTQLAITTLEWCQALKQQLAETVELKLWVSSAPHPELEFALSQLDESVSFEIISTAPGAARGRQRNTALASLRESGLDALICLEPGDLLTPSLLQAYAQHLKSGGLFCGLLDQYLYDPSTLRCMHWARGEFYQEMKRACDLGLMISTSLLDLLDWQLWPQSAHQGREKLHEHVMERLATVFRKAPAQTCLLQTMRAYGGTALTLKSELGRVLFDEGNWQKLPGLSFADFEITFEEEFGPQWIERLEDLDERIQLAVLVEAPSEKASHQNFWRDYHQFLPFKFDPYARVEVHVICAEEDREEVSSWGSAFQPLVVSSNPHQNRAACWNEALTALQDSEQTLDAVLLGGVGSIVDLKTIEHYIIYMFQHGARLLSTSNFFVTFGDHDEVRQGHFWPGTPNTHFKDSFGFGTCVHLRYLQQLGPHPLDEHRGMSESARLAFDEICKVEESKHERVMFQCITHKLGLIAFEAEGALGFTSRIRLADLKPVTISSHLPPAALARAQHQQLKAWERGEVHSYLGSTSESSPESSPTAFATSSSAPLLSTTSPSTSSHHSTDSSSTDRSPMSTQTSQLSPLERAKALLQKSQSSTSAHTSLPSSAPESSQAPQAQSVSSSKTAAPTNALSPLERAKALLQQSRGATNSQETPTLQQEPPPPQVEPPVSTQEAPKALETPETNSIINQAVRDAESLQAQLQSQLEAARAQEAAHAAQTGPALILCEQGEDAYESGDQARAVTLLESALLVDPTCTRALNNLGVIALSNDDPWRSLSYLLMALMLAPQDQDVIVNLKGLFDLHPEMSTARHLIFS